MTDQVLDILKLVLLVLLYLFFARVVWAVWSEVRQPVDTRRALDPTPAAGVGMPGGAAAAPDSTRGLRRGGPAKGRGEVPARLVILQPKERSGVAFPITGSVTIGRETDNAVVITGDEYVSSRHATITLEGPAGPVAIVDHGSRNGTYLNGSKLTHRQTVRRGDRIQIGYTVLEAQ